MLATLKESATETEQVLSQARKRNLSANDISELCEGLRMARRARYLDLPIPPRIATCFDVLGLDASTLVADPDGDAPDRFASAPLDWTWKPAPPKAPRYHEVQRIPRVGDRVRHHQSSAVGIVTAYRPHGSRGYVVRVYWGERGVDELGLPMGFERRLGQSALVLVAASTMERFVHAQPLSGVLCPAYVETRDFLTRVDGEVTCPACIDEIVRSGCYTTKTFQRARTTSPKSDS